ncbi:MAG: hypothetical protein A2748_00325 [Candidatus Wildermuthbacteria bacterium RIFCSPHIGHO2_01_FULL_45_20]|uniref:Uncharacterized protein n=1 Tax=Candidatus Wildermuthbacteria bacterium RIFCSPHIGHO2_02_FULL_45_25 TaxID=1802450 RepID=A0A1G2QXY3_9BACT|nr:MAG: hypothetical protein A2748_00325 [Candidatus Wildermuthbacteria bacterium RIFCSPHIGHO2_01_FULL_45_20]OHA65494.1 MAG: hypothetical protein A3C04_02770 [Candidatus Wildermuthbacteria bacterium RIFCSPHIGHO2_02_FULL_45_25]
MSRGTNAPQSLHRFRLFQVGTTLENQLHDYLFGGKNNQPSQSITCVIFQKDLYVVVNVLAILPTSQHKPRKYSRKIPSLSRKILLLQILSGFVFSYVLRESVLT